LLRRVKCSHTHKLFEVMMVFPGIKHYLCVFMLQGSGAGGFGTYRERDEI